MEALTRNILCFPLMQARQESGEEEAGMANLVSVCTHRSIPSWLDLQVRFFSLS